MKFYNREHELETLQKVRETAFSQHSKLTVLTGRRRIGKTSLVLKSSGNTPTLYLFVGRNSEADLCDKFAQTIVQTLHVVIPGKIYSFVSLFEFLMDLGTRQKFNLIIDEFQEFYNINPAVYSGMQDVWDRFRIGSNINLIVSGSVYTLMERIFRDEKEPLYGRSDRVLKLRPFTTSVLKQILADFKPDYTHEDLLALYTFTGGIPKYVELFLDSGSTDMEAMVDFMTQPDSPFLDEGKTLLIQEFGKKYGNYFSILTAIADGNNTISAMETKFAISLGGHLKRLEEDYELISKKRPIFSKEGTQTLRYEITDPFLKFWFRYFEKYSSLIEINNFKALAHIIKNDYPAYSGTSLEYYFRQRMEESQEYRNIGSWWCSKGDPCEIDIVGIYTDNKRALIAEVKRQRKNFMPELLHKKEETIRNKVLSAYEIQSKCWSMEDM
jgi:AAA+ ATPase superfamily predicted ATPase